MSTLTAQEAVVTMDTIMEMTMDIATHTIILTIIRTITSMIMLMKIKKI